MLNALHAALTPHAAALGAVSTLRTAAKTYVSSALLCSCNPAEAAMLSYLETAPLLMS